MRQRKGEDSSSIPYEIDTKEHSPFLEPIVDVGSQFVCLFYVAKIRASKISVDNKAVLDKQENT
ncbi:MAG: hypothetical protein Q8R40_01335 [bacterium]|nr:hypothetical protein [bacterium]